MQDAWIRLIVEFTIPPVFESMRCITDARIVKDAPAGEVDERGSYLTFTPHRAAVFRELAAGPRLRPCRRAFVGLRAQGPRLRPITSALLLWG